MVVYGRSGTGKTTLAASFPQPALILDVKDRGTDSVSDVTDLKVLYITNWDDFEDAYYALLENKHYKTVIIDTVSQLQDIAIQHVTGGGKKDGNWGSMTKQDWGEVASLLKTWLIRYRDLGINVVYIAQDRVFNVEEEDENQIAPEIGPRIMPSVAAVLNAGVDIITHTFIRENKVVKVVNNKRIEKRTLEFAARVGPHITYVTKIRKPKDVIPPSFVSNPTYDKIISLIKVD